MTLIHSMVYQAIKVHEEFFIPGEVIIEQGNVIDQLYIICHGEVVWIFLFSFLNA
jgi:CRP-like cAMP-binding protein